MEEDCLYREQCRQEAEEDTEWNMLQYIGIIFLNIDNIVYYLLAKVFWYSKLQLENMLGGNSEVDTFSSLIKNRSQTRTRTKTTSEKTEFNILNLSGLNSFYIGIQPRLSSHALFIIMTTTHCLPSRPIDV